MREKKREPFAYRLDCPLSVWDDDGNPRPQEELDAVTTFTPIDKNGNPILPPRRIVSAKVKAKRRKRRKLARKSQQINRR